MPAIGRSIAHRVGYGHLYQGRYKSFPVEGDEHFYQLVRYVERNALRAGSVETGRRLAMEQLVAAKARHAGAAGPVERLARAPAARLGPAT